MRLRGNAVEHADVRLFCFRRLWCLFTIIALCDCPAMILSQVPSSRESAFSFDIHSDRASTQAKTFDDAAVDLPDAPLSFPTSSESASRVSPKTLSPMVIRAAQPVIPDKFNFKGAFSQTFNENLFFHIWRVAFDPGMRYNIAHKPFFHDWFASYGGYDMHRWGDGDNFIVNDVGHPLEGAVFADSFINNSPRSQIAFGKTSRYWTSRLKAMSWATVWSVQLEMGPISETSFGNQGGFNYVPDCGVSLSCLNNPKYPKPVTDNTGWTDFVVTPIFGTVVVIGEDIAERYLVVPLAIRHPILGGRVLRSAIEPTRSFSAIFAGKFPWELPTGETGFIQKARPRWPTVSEPEARSPIDRVEVGPQYTNISLPVLGHECSATPCRKNLSAPGFNFAFNFVHNVAFDSSLNFIPGQHGTDQMIEGLFGFKVGARFKHVGVFGKARPGFIYYENALPGGGVKSPTDLTRFATDFGGVIELYNARKSIWRVDVGTTVVRYLADHPDPKQYPLGSLLSTDYIVTQGNFQISTSYKFHF
jgi:hypothetical protein